MDLAFLEEINKDAAIPKDRVLGFSGKSEFRIFFRKLDT
jgi:hypothetical protein